MVTPFFQSADYQAIKPEILLAMFGLAILLFDFLLEKRDKYMNALTALAGLALAGLKLGMYWLALHGQRLPRFRRRVHARFFRHFRQAHHRDRHGRRGVALGEVSRRLRMRTWANTTPCSSSQPSA